MHSTTATTSTREPARYRDEVATSATRIVVSTFGLLAGLAGIEHGVGEMLQGSVRPEGPVIESWPDSKAFEILGGEPALTVIPNLLVTGIAAVIVAVAVVVWSVRFVDRRHGGLVLILLSVLLLLVGGGFGPPLIGVIVGFGATRIGTAARRRPGRVAWAVGRVWPWVLGTAVFGRGRARAQSRQFRRVCGPRPACSSGAPGLVGTFGPVLGAASGRRWI